MPSGYSGHDRRSTPDDQSAHPLPRPATATPRIDPVEDLRRLVASLAGPPSRGSRRFAVGHRRRPVRPAVALSPSGRERITPHRVAREQLGDATERGARRPAGMAGTSPSPNLPLVSDDPRPPSLTARLGARLAGTSVSTTSGPRPGRESARATAVRPTAACGERCSWFRHVGSGVFSERRRPWPRFSTRRRASRPAVCR